METFLVRIWTEADGAAEAQGSASPSLHGFVRHIRSGSEARFADPAELVAVLVGASRSSAPAGTAGGPDRGRPGAARRSGVGAR